MSKVRLTSEQHNTVRENTALWYELTGIGPDGLPISSDAKLSLYKLIQRALRGKGRLSQFADREMYGRNTAEQRQKIALELCSLWLQRMLICHQLEARLVRMHRGDSSYRFFRAEYLSNWESLEQFLLEILPQPIMFRPIPFSFVPPLEIPLFQAHKLEELLSIKELGLYEKKAEDLLSLLLNCLGQEDEQLIFSYLPHTPIPAEQAKEIATLWVAAWHERTTGVQPVPPRICDPLMLNDMLLSSSCEAWMQYYFPMELPDYQVSAGPGGFNRHVPHKIQQAHADYFQQLSVFTENQLFGVAPDFWTLGWVKVRLWAFLLNKVPFDASTNYELLYPLPPFRHQLTTGPSLISQYRLDSDMQKMLKGNKLRFKLYCSALEMYQDAGSEKEKEEARGMLEDMQKNFRTRLQASDPDFQRLKRLEKTAFMKRNPLFGDLLAPEKEAEQKLQQLQLERQIERLRARLSGKTHAKQTFEWRYQFPELLNAKDARFTGFDIILLHPEEPKDTETEISTNQALSLMYKLCKVNGLAVAILPDHFNSKKVFQKGRKVVFEKFSLLEETYLEGDGFGELCTGKIRFVLHKRSLSLEK